MDTAFLGKCKSAVYAFVAAALLLPGTVFPAAPAPDILTINLSPNPVVEGNDATITGTLTDTASPTPNPLAGQDMSIEMLQADGTTTFEPAQGVPCGSTTNWQQAGKGTTNSEGKYGVTFNTSGLGGKSICFRAHHAVAGGGYEEKKSAEVNLVIQSGPTCSGVTLSNPTVVSFGSDNPDGSVTGPWRITMNLTNCLGRTVEFKVQGGANAWAPYVPNSATVSNGTLDYKVNKKTTVIIWNVSTSGTEHITFDVGQGATLPCGPIIQPLTGAWSAAYTDPDTGLPAKSAYNEPGTITTGVCQ